ncbi:PH domain-containing protein [Sphingobacterium wenxiniae]|uniref:Short C-terminal domain-containing protein n=1 Tax=Sphingobacterium wenxiniae TaxID=683125 RepID=A0A1I6VEE6_9SPHI|nr:PH domain-containing protein [Sphingobacterium wenxiniae]SFT12027.1 Short C-terminal domain-containing protein [Sphingobacterium wenxiniae]
MSLDKFLQDGQDPKIVEKIHDKIIDMLTTGEFIQYIAVQKKPAVTLLPDSITVSNKRIFLCEFTKLGLATNFEIFSWNDIKDIAFKEEIFGSKVTVIPFTGENLTIDYIPKVQARKLYQIIKDALENKNNPHFITEVEKPAFVSPVEEIIEEEIIEEPAIELTIDSPIQEEQESFTVLSAEPITKEEDELTAKLKKLKTLYDRQLITQSEYESKKAELLSQL